MARKHLRVYYDMMPAIEALSDAEAGRLLKGVMKYGLSAELPNFSGNERFTWPLFMAQIDQENADYEKRCEINKTNRNKSSQVVTSRDESSKPQKNKAKSAAEPEEVTNNNIKRFIPPTVEQVAEYCRERNNNINPEHFVDYYASNGWKVGKSPMKDWKAAVRNWEKMNKERQPVSRGAAELQSTYEMMRRWAESEEE